MDGDWKFKFRVKTYKIMIHCYCIKNEVRKRGGKKIKQITSHYVLFNVEKEILKILPHKTIIQL